MSHWSVVELQMNDSDCIKSALKDMGYECEVFKEAQDIQGFGQRNFKKANIVIRQKHLGNRAWGDLGFVKNDEGTYSLISDFRYSWKDNVSYKDEFMKQLTQLYGKHKVIKQAKRLGYHVSSTKMLEDGRIKVKVRC